MKKSLLTLVLCAGLISVPSFAQAATPAPVAEAYKAIYSGKPYKMTLTNKTVVDFLGMEIATAIKGTGYEDSDGDAEGKISVTLTFEDPEKKGKSQKITLPMEYKYFPDAATMYFKFGKLPKDAGSVLDEVKANTWYKQVDSEDFSNLTGQGVFAGENFVAANNKYQAVVFTEKGSTKKEYVYQYSVDENLFKSFLAEKARLDGEVFNADASGTTAMLTEAEGTLRINKKTGLLTKMTMEVNSEVLSSQTSATYKFGGSKDVVPVKGALNSDAIEGILGGM